MTWRDRLRPASFRGVPFRVDSHEMEIGNRVEIIRRAGVAEVILQKLGPEARSFTLTAYVIGPDYLEARDRLEAAVLNPDEGTLVHPTRGELQVIVAGKVRIVESKADGGMARFTIPMVEARPAPRSMTRPDRPAQTAAAASAAATATRTAFAERFDVSRQTPALRTVLAADLASALTAIGTASNALSNIGGDIAAVTAKADSAISNLDSLMSSPLALADAAVAVVDEAYSAARTLAESAITFVGSLALDDADTSSRPPARDVIESIVRGAEQMQNLGLSGATDDARRAFDLLVRVMAITSTAGVLASLPFESFNQAAGVSSRLVEVLTGLDDLADDTTFGVLADLRTALVDHLTQVASTLPELRSWTVPSPLSSLVIAHLVFGDARREDEIVYRNRLLIPHPGMVPPGASLEVLGA